MSYFYDATGSVVKLVVIFFSLSSCHFLMCLTCYEGPRRELSQDDIDAPTFLYPARNDGGDPDPEPDPTPDTDPPTIINLASAKLHPKNGRFEITFTTEVAANSEVRFLSPVTDAFADAAFVTSHQFAFRGQSGTRYVYEVISTDAAGNKSLVVRSEHQN